MAIPPDDSDSCQLLRRFLSALLPLAASSTPAGSWPAAPELSGALSSSGGGGKLDRDLPPLHLPLRPDHYCQPVHPSLPPL
jgi:hypothetical protein